MVGTINFVRVISSYQLFWGFALGFFISTVFHAFLVADNVKGVPMMVFGDKAVAFEKLYPRDQDAPYPKAFSEFSRNVDKVKFIFTTSALIAVVILLVFLITIS